MPILTGVPDAAGMLVAAVVGAAIVEAPVAALVGAAIVEAPVGAAIAVAGIVAAAVGALVAPVFGTAAVGLVPPDAGCAAVGVAGADAGAQDAINVAIMIRLPIKDHLLNINFLPINKLAFIQKPVVSVGLT